MGERDVDVVVIGPGAAGLAAVGSDEITASAVVIASGGFDNAPDLLARHFPSATATGTEVAPFYAVELRPATVCFTAFGLQIDGEAGVRSSDGWAIPGLLAAGECTGGVVGEQYVGSSNSYANCVVIGRIAGTTAARSPIPAEAFS